eukprot:gnl/Chilomastix_caulleri/485.p1 GENE.gnl/Chilomastix_caulleri/485~~gnl/Chilomastix_caulleri/485.p1  ORF type:complete len:119 (+),score=36.39 gnl/Chilomastix_caulleri/485:740-1096(+)
MVIKLMETLCIKAVFFHTAGLYVSVISRDFQIEIGKEALAHGFKTAEKVIIDKRSVEGTKIIDVPVCEKTKVELDKSEELFPNYSINYHNAHMIKPISSTVGLGDTISSSIVLGSLTF